MKRDYPAAIVPSTVLQRMSVDVPHGELATKTPKTAARSQQPRNFRNPER